MNYWHAGLAGCGTCLSTAHIWHWKGALGVSWLTNQGPAMVGWTAGPQPLASARSRCGLAASTSYAREGDQQTSLLGASGRGQRSHRYRTQPFKDIATYEVKKVLRETLILEAACEDERLILEMVRVTYSCPQEEHPTSKGFLATTAPLSILGVAITKRSWMHRKIDELGPDLDVGNPCHPI